ncbi:hypothetical protein JVX88_12050 [Leptolyngbya sp. 7M]|nr:hypothetical protein JVX88_12050 [Leptolyngbya sp. 7M]
MAIVMYVKPGCPYCQQARDHYNANGITFVEYDAQNDLARQREMLAMTGGDEQEPNEFIPLCLTKASWELERKWSERHFTPRSSNVNASSNSSSINSSRRDAR